MYHTSSQQTTYYFSKRNTLFIGDSLGRRAYTTLFAMMNGQDFDNLMAEELDSPNVIDINKARRPQEMCQDKSRRLLLLRSKNVSGFLCRTIERNDFKKDSSNPTEIIQPYYNGGGKGKFDLISAACFLNISDIFIPPEIMNYYNITDGGLDKSFFIEYDLIVTNMGIWDVIRKNDCSKSLPSSTNLAQKLDQFLASLEEISSPEVQVVIKTPGFRVDHSGDDEIWQIINHINHYSTLKIRQSMSEEHHLPNMTVVDWGTVISKRSWGGERINGDIGVHYGLEARLLFLQQLLHELLAEEQRQRN
mmetsp:Transcript_18313/g.39582  ORF Transcript_18313/g.39582 Transcript_18313/m.39582 type:complete len:305 (-) Transcript_18313:36-950(-)